MLLFRALIPCLAAYNTTLVSVVFSTYILQRSVVFSTYILQRFVLHLFHLFFLASVPRPSPLRVDLRFKINVTTINAHINAQWGKPGNRG